MRALSIGNAQYDADQISLKVWRHTGEKWSRQSEELPIHRNIDLTILFLGALLAEPRSGLSSTILREEIVSPSKFHEIKDYYDLHESFLKPRLEELRDKLNKFLE